ncbi:uncharacterized protein LOC113134914 [Mastacembelus armatus]|uniref:uncharacterized protein LOC113134914 n=1 Tax=Mastacembelus armatus TaxID=205130 RepID=UPI000E461A42|nr:uncharacterized protein LOC113134914 [Mastacembelus armatus]
MLQQNNNNNYPCLNVSGTTREMLQKCSRAALPFPSRLELGLGDLPLIRGLRAWALCSKNRRRAGGLPGGGQAPTAPPAGRGSLASCPKPADVYLSGEWGRLGYGLPLGLDARQAGIGALITVATLKTSEGSGKPQTQCLFLQTEKGSCLYSTAKPGSGVTTSAASSVVGGWLRGKTGEAGGRDTPARRRDNGTTQPAQTGANRVRVRSGRRWRKSGNAAGCEKLAVSRERQQRSREDPAGEITLEERQEERDNGALDSKQFSSPQRDGKRARQEKEAACKSPTCCHSASPKTCTQSGRKAQRTGSQEEHEGGEGLRRGIPKRLTSEVKGMKKERQKKEEEEKGGLCDIESSNAVLVEPNHDLKSNCCHTESPSSSDVEQIRQAECSDKLKTDLSRSKAKCSEKEQDANSDIVKIHTGNSDFSHVHSAQSTGSFKSTHNSGSGDRKPPESPCEEPGANADGFADCVEESQESEKTMERGEVEEEARNIKLTPADCSVVSNYREGVSASTSTAVLPESPTPAEGSTCTVQHKAFWLQGEQGNIQEEHLEGHQQEEADSGVTGKEELDFRTFEPQELNFVAEVINTVNKGSPSPPRHRDPSIVEADLKGHSADCRAAVSEQKAERLNPEEGAEAGGTWRRVSSCNKLDNDSGQCNNDKEQDTEEEISVRDIQEDKETKRNCAPTDNWRLQESANGSRERDKENPDPMGQTKIIPVEENGKTSTNVANIGCADPSTSRALSPANPAPPLQPLGSMATGLPCLVAEEDEEEDKEGAGVTARDGEGGQEGKRRELEGEEESSSTVATEEGRKEEEGEEDEFGVFMQAEGEPPWGEGFTLSASVPCGSGDSVALGNNAITGESTHWTPGWTDTSFHQSDETWTAFPQASSGESPDAVGQWWPASAVEERRNRLSANNSLAAVFAEAFPSLPGSSSSDPCDLDTVPTLTQLLRGTASQDQGLLDSFHDLNKIIGQRYKRASSASRGVLLKTLHLEQPQTESRPAPWTANRRLSPGLPSANQNAAAKRRLSYDYNRNIME